MSHTYSRQWFDTFLAPIPAEQTAREIDFLTRQLPQPAYKTILDVCCGMGRHARELSQRGYAVTGLDANTYALEHARRVDAQTRYVQGDMRALDTLQESFDAVLILWQSFGNFDETTNENIVKQIAQVLNPRGRFVLDIYNRPFFETRLGERRFERDSGIIVETKTMQGNRLHVELNYGDARDTYEWQVFYPDEISALAARCDLQEKVRCANFDETVLPSSDIPRMQFVFEAL